MKYIVILMLMSTSIIFAETKFEDLNKEHWAYKSINSLVERGILKENKYKFKGNEALTRYDFAENLARSIDYIDLKKANKEDLNKIFDRFYRLDEARYKRYDQLFRPMIEGDLINEPYPKKFKRFME